VSRKDLNPYLNIDARDAYAKGMVSFNKWHTHAEPFTTDDDAWAFAFWWSLKEASHFNIKSADVWQKLTDNPEFGHLFLRRMLAWVAARLEWTVYYMKAHCPDLNHPDDGVRRAAELGWSYADPLSTTDAAILEFLTDKKKPLAAKRAFFRYAANPAKATTRHPDLDGWLILIWPVVKEYKWKLCQVREAACRKFPTLKDKHPLTHDSDMAKHCAKLKLRVSGKRGGNKRRVGNADIPPLADLVQKIGV
jgi:hypothetical protein